MRCCFLSVLKPSDAARWKEASVINCFDFEEERQLMIVKQFEDANYSVLAKMGKKNLDLEVFRVIFSFQVFNFL